MNKLVILIAIGTVLQICSGSYVPTFTGDTLRKVLKREGCGHFQKEAKRIGLDITFITRSATIFCPTDKAFSNLPQRMKRILKKNLNTLYFVILYHMYIDNILKSSDLKDGLMLSTIVDQRSFLNVRRSKNGVDIWINGAKLVKKDIQATNGIVHVIDRVILPPPYTLAELLNHYKTLSIMRNIMVSGKTLLPVGFTCFALLDRAFNNVEPQRMKAILGSRRTLTQMSRTYILPRIIFGGAMKAGKPFEVATLSGRMIRIVPEDDEIYLELQGVSYPSKASRPKVAKSDIMTRNGVVHTIDNLLIPQPVRIPPNEQAGRRPDEKKGEESKDGKVAKPEKPEPETTKPDKIKPDMKTKPTDSKKPDSKIVTPEATTEGEESKDGKVAKPEKPEPETTKPGKIKPDMKTKPTDSKKPDSKIVTPEATTEPEEGKEAKKPESETTKPDTIKPDKEPKPTDSKKPDSTIAAPEATTEPEEGKEAKKPESETTIPDTIKPDTIKPDKEPKPTDSKKPDSTIVAPEATTEAEEDKEAKKPESETTKPDTIKPDKEPKPTDSKKPDSKILTPEATTEPGEGKEAKKPESETTKPDKIIPDKETKPTDSKKPDSKIDKKTPEATTEREECHEAKKPESETTKPDKIKPDKETKSTDSKKPDSKIVAPEATTEPEEDKEVKKPESETTKPDTIKPDKKPEPTDSKKPDSKIVAPEGTTEPEKDKEVEKPESETTKPDTIKPDKKPEPTDSKKPDSKIVAPEGTTGVESNNGDAVVKTPKPDSETTTSDKMDKVESKQTESKKPDTEDVKPKPETETSEGNVIPTESSIIGATVSSKPTSEPSNNKIAESSRKQFTGDRKSGGQVDTEKSPGRVPEVVAPKLFTIAEELSKHGLTLFLDAIKRNSDVYDIIASDGPKHTIFAPTDNAFQQVEPSFQKNFQSSNEFVKKSVLFHITKRAINVSNINRYKEIPSLTEDKLVFRRFGEKSMIGKATIISKAIKASNGFVFIVDRLCIPTKQNLEKAIDLYSLATFKLAVEKAGLQDKLIKRGGIPLIIWAPSDEAFNNLPPKTLEYLLNNKEQVKKLISYHITPGFFYTDLMDKSWVYVFKSLNKVDKIRTRKYGPAAEDISIWNPNGENARGVVLNVKTTNGIINVIDRVLIPDGLDIPYFGQTTADGLDIGNGEKIVEKNKRRKF